MFISLPKYSIFFLLLFLTCLKSYADDDDNTPPDIHAKFTVHIDKTTQSTTDIKTLELESTQFIPEIETFAVRLNLAPLVNTRKEYFIALAEQETARIKLEHNQRNVKRLKKLQKDQAVSTRKLRIQQTQLKIDQTLFNTAQLHANNIQLQAQANWGSVLSHWFLSEDAPYTHMMDTLRKALYLIYYPSHLATPSKTISIQPFGIREKAQAASYVGDAPPLGNTQQQTGTPFFYLSDQTLSGYHQRVVAWLPLKEDKVTGIIIPVSALVWHLGQAYVYLQVDDELFKRIKISQKKLISTKSYFIQEELQQGDKLVSIGAQMLLSEEFRGQIPAEDDDD